MGGSGVLKKKRMAAVRIQYNSLRVNQVNLLSDLFSPLDLL